MTTTSTIRHYDALYHEAGGVVRALGQRGLRQPVEKTNAADGRVVEQDFVVEPGDMILVWDGDADGSIRDFAFLRLIIIGSGTLNLYWIVDTVDVDGAYTGAQEKACPDSMSCLLPAQWCTPDIETNPTAADVTGVSGGLPVLESDAGTVLGKRKRLYVKNPDTATANVKVRLEVGE